MKQRSAIVPHAQSPSWHTFGEASITIPVAASGLSLGGRRLDDRPAAPHTAIDNRLTSAAALEDQVAKLIASLSNRTP
jgi:hypothetical protein